MFSEILNFIQMMLHTIAPVMIVILTIVLVWLGIMGRKWKKQDPERWNRTY